MIVVNREKLNAIREPGIVEDAVVDAELLLRSIHQLLTVNAANRHYEKLEDLAKTMLSELRKLDKSFKAKG